MATRRAAPHSTGVPRKERNPCIPCYGGSATVAACLVALALAAPAPAAGDNTTGSALDRYLYTSLRIVINHGVDLYNTGRVDECYAHFRQSLQA